MATSIFEAATDVIKGIATGGLTGGRSARDWVMLGTGEMDKIKAEKEAANAPPPRILEKDTKPIMEHQDVTTFDFNSTILDRDWTKAAFLINETDLDDVADRSNRYWSTAANKFTDTRMGGNLGVNARPQFTRYADTRVKGRINDRNDVNLHSVTGNIGMGRYYSEAIDDNAQTIYMRFGVPQYNSLTNFISKAFNKEATVLARTGRAPSAWYQLGKIAGYLAPLYAFPILTVSIGVMSFISQQFQRPTSKFYTMKPTMYTYWMAVSHLVNVLAVNRGILPKIMNDDKSAQKMGDMFKLDQDYLTLLHELMPDIFSTQNYLDIPAMANKAARNAEKLKAGDYDRLNKGTNTNWEGYVKKDATGNDVHSTEISNDTGEETLSAWVADMLRLGDYYGTKEDTERLDIDPRIDLKSEKGDEYKDSGRFISFGEHFDAENAKGSQFAIFKVDHTGPVTETFSNAVTESDISQKLNTVSSQVREARFSFANGNIADNAFVNMAESAVSALGDLAAGGIDSAFFGFGSLIAGLGGSGYIDIPKHWQSSTAQLPKSVYTMDLISPYGNPFSQLQNIYIPLCMLLAAALPLSTGKSSYTSPYLCQIFDRGRCQIKLGMIENITVTRGITNLPFNKAGQALSMNVSFSVVDLSSILHMPISSGIIGEAFDMTLDEDNILSDYLAVLAGQDLSTQLYGMNKGKLTLAKRIMKLGALFSKASQAAMVHEMLESVVPTPIYTVIEGMTRSPIMEGQQ